MTSTGLTEEEENKYMIFIKNLMKNGRNFVGYPITQRIIEITRKYGNSIIKNTEHYQVVVNFESKYKHGEDHPSSLALAILNVCQDLHKNHIISSDQYAEYYNTPITLDSFEREAGQKELAKLIAFYQPYINYLNLRELKPDPKNKKM
ncbi:hypothetical protein TVAG_180850 [Trichomonas vaginalis G3]|uniref:Uncharacterized protein n=1 Tax=Trichomonas vaginalis (strain ATCC PRA-98 / G3) TaxID=412133 RepID=A2F398_TRIV3|nr:hypothetical protein TVAGG3_1027810 [Trichomonas vaginalis G3]EAY00607.1 hypothetical protein TVAG_180850 [Trichomonas vaginalis G3]KAI5492632.1 hypothetical protein TVAGG3_1027810 [Trichomonas vaginalis G3]|eukprot:XP_001313536.1 hypothetical protein [Trichomonas vaginalis G3]